MADVPVTTGRRGGPFPLIASRAVDVAELTTPALLVDADALEHNLATMAAALPGPRLRPHVKAHKCTALARAPGGAGHTGFTCATIREVEGMAAAGLGDDLLLANEVLDAHGGSARLDARVTVAVDSERDDRRRGRAGGVREVADRRQRRPAPLRLRTRRTPARLADLARARGPRRCAA